MKGKHDAPKARVLVILPHGLLSSRHIPDIPLVIGLLLLDLAPASSSSIVRVSVLVADLTA
jgi:hypothetical protein